MSQLGSYELLREIHRSPLAVVYAARRAGDDADRAGRYAVKAFDADSYGLLESVASAQTFLERAAVQKALADGGAHHWAPVLETGDPDDTPYYATELYPLTAQKVVDRGAPVGVRGLYTVVWSVVRGLTELRETFRRAHGNLKLTNVLIRGREGRSPDLRSASPRTTEVVLVDPAVEASSARDRSADLSAVGELIHQFVLKRPFARPKDPDELDPPLVPDHPVAYTAAWGKLGPQGREWLDLCNWLLSPDPSDRPNDLMAVAVALHQLAPGHVRRAPRWAAAAAVPLLLGGAAAAAGWHVHGAVRAELVAVNRQWFGPFEQALADPARQQRYAADETLRAVADLVRRARQDGVRFDPSADPMLSYAAYRNAQAALEVARRVERELAPERWQRLAAQGKLRQGYEARGWAQPARFVGDLMAGARPGAGPDLAAGVDRLMDVTGRIGPDALWLDEQWVRYEADLKVARDTGDPVLAAFARQLRESVGATLRLTDAGFDGLDAFKARLPLAAGLAEAVRGGFPQGYGRDRVAAEVESKLNVANPSEADVREWLDALPQYALVRLDPKAEPLLGLSGSLEKLGTDVNDQRLEAAERAQYAAERADVDGRIRALADDRFVRRHVAQFQGELPGRVGEIKRDLDGLRKKWVRQDDPRRWIEYIDRPLASASDALKERWKGYVESQRTRADALGRNAEAFKNAKAQADLVSGVLTELDKQFPPVVAGGLSGPLANAAWERRERDLRALSEWAAGADPTPPADLNAFATTVADRGAAYREWCGKLGKLVDYFPVKKELLTPFDRPDLALAAKDKAFWSDPIVQNVVRKDLERIAAVAAVAGMPRDALEKAAAEAPAAEVAIAAWRRLGDPAQGGAGWPGTEAELRREQKLRDRIGAVVTALKLGPDRQRAEDEWRAEGPVRWRRFTNRAVLDPPGDAAAVKQLRQRIVTALAYVNSMRVTREEIDRLDPVARFNYALYVAGGALTERSEAVVEAARGQLAAAIAGLKDRPEVQDLSRRLDRVREPEPMSGDARLRTPAGEPAKAFAVPLGGEPPLTFALVQPKAGRPFYLATTELSVGQFRELVSATGTWSAANALLGNASVPGGKGPVPHRGPRVWERPPSVAAPIERLVEWRYDDAAGVAQPFKFEDTLRAGRFNAAALNPEYGDNPKLDHPMQQLPAQAALYAAAAANFRLPTPREWLAAHDRERQEVGDPAKLDPNLRDATWRRQQEFTAAKVPGQWPDALVAGEFWPKGLPRPAAAAPAARPADDRTLFFRPVTGGSGTFRNLIGNVAELVCDNPDAFEAAANRRTVDGVQQFCKQHGSSILVIGGSAFSAPELDPLRPYPVTSPADPYADVGVRPAFTAPAASVAERLKWFIDEQPFLAATAAAKAGG